MKSVSLSTLSDIPDYHGTNQSAENSTVMVHKELHLWPTQKQHIMMTHEALRVHQRVVSSGPTACGKRYMAVWWCQRVAEKGRRVLVVTDRLALIAQMCEELRRFGVRHGVIQGSTLADDVPLVQVASIQTLRSRDYRQWTSPDWIIVDECHKEPAAYASLFEMYPKAKVVGLTATPVGPSGSTLLGLYDHLVIGTRNADLLEQKRVLSVTTLAPSEPNMKGVKVSKYEYTKDSLTHVVEKCTSFGDVFKEWEPYQDRPTIIFVPALRYGRWLAQEFKDRGYTAEAIDYTTSAEDRQGLYAAFHSGKVPAMLSYDVLRGGFDCAASCGIDLQPNQQLRTFVQKCGRVRRQRGVESRAVWIDMAGNCYRHLFHPDDDIPWNDVVGDRTTAEVVETYRSADPLVRCRYCAAQWRRKKGEGKLLECKSCGKELKPADQKAVRRIRMGNGKLREVKPGRMRKERKHKSNQSRWNAEVYSAIYRNSTLKSARYLYYKKYGNWPGYDLDYTPTKGSNSWTRRPREVYPNFPRK